MIMCFSLRCRSSFLVSRICKRIVWNESKDSTARTGPDVGLDFTDQPAPAPDMPPQPPAGEDAVDHPGYEDPHGDMPLDDEDMPPPQDQHPEPDLDDDSIELDTGGDPPSEPPSGAGTGWQTPIWMRLWIRTIMAATHLQEAVQTVGVMSLHVDDLIISGTPEVLTWFLKKIKEHFTVGHEDKNERLRWVLDAQGNKKYISIDQKLCVSELEEILIPKHLKDADACDQALHTSYRSVLGSINWLQSRRQFQACYQFSRLASASAAPTVGHCKELNKLCRQIRSEEVELRVWPVKGSPRILGIPDAAFRNNSDKSSQRAMTIFIADERVKNRRDTRGSLVSALQSLSFTL